MLKVVFCGSNQFGIGALRALQENEAFEVNFVVSTPAKPVGRKKVLTLPPVGQTAEEEGWELLTPADVQEWRKIVEEREAPDFLVVISYGMILPKFVLDWAKIAPVNVHPSLLPKYRGATPVQSALLNGDTETGVAIMKMEMKMDAGPIYAVENLPLTGTETADDLFVRVGEVTAELLPKTMLEIADGLTARPQAGEPSYCGKIAKSDGRLNLRDLTAEEMFNRYRAYSSWPGVFMEINGQRLLLKELSFARADLALEPAGFTKSEARVWLGTKTEAVEVLALQPAGKNVMAASDWYNGHQGSK